MGDNLYWMITITDRNQSQKFLSFYKTYGIEVVLSTLGKGTAASEILNDFGLEATQKAVLLSVVTGKVWSAVQKGLQTIMLIDSWRDQAALDAHHASPMMATIAELREKYDLHMRVERFVTDAAGVPSQDATFIRA